MSIVLYLQGVEKTAAQRKVEELEKNVATTSQQVRELQQDWLRAQAHVVILSEQRQKQAQDISLTRKRKISNILSPTLTVLTPLCPTNPCMKY